MLDARRKIQEVIFLFKNVDNLIFDINSRIESKELIIRLNTEDQLFNKGEDATGRTLESIGGAYAPSTVENKKRQGLPFDRVTLADTFEFYDSWTIIVRIDEIEIIVDPVKPGGVNLLDEWGENVVGLNEENLNVYRQYVKEALKKLLRKELSKIA
jgi:hypothetical protein